MDFLNYEIDIYLVIVLIAVVFVAGTILLLSRITTAKKSASKKGKKKPKERAGLLPEKPRDLAGEKPLEKITPNPQEKSIEGPPLEAAAKLAQKPITEPTPGATAKPAEEPGKMPLLQIQRATDVKQAISAGKPAEHEAAAGAGRAWETGEIKQQAENTGTAAPARSRLWEPEATKETEEEEEKPEESKEEGSVMDIFSEEEEEDSELSELAANLNDVELDSLLKLGSEVSENLPRSNPAKQRR
jgi:hypothetical protein